MSSAQHPPPFAQPAAPPTGWTGTWPPPAPMGYPGGAPPPPQGMKVDPKTWSQGQWQLNPMFRGMPVGHTQHWAPHPMWNQPQPSADFNPFKRKPNPGDAAYWATQLSDNPLGLSNMDIRNMNAHTQVLESAELPHTPFFWAPGSLSESPERHDQSGELHGEHGVRDKQRAHTLQRSKQEDDWRRKVHEAFKRPHSLGPERVEALQNHNKWTSEDFKAHEAWLATFTSREVDDAKRLTSREVRSYWDFEEIQFNVNQAQMHYLREEMEAQLQKHYRQLCTAQAGVSATEPVRPRTAAPSSSTTQPPASSAPASYRSGTLQDQQAKAHEERQAEAPTSERRSSEEERGRSAFSSISQLQPTFSPLIVRTPQHYSSASAAATASTATTAALPTTPTPSRSGHDRSQSSSRAHGPIYGPPTPRNATPVRSSSDSSTYVTPPRQSSSSSTLSRSGTGPSPLSNLPTYSEEPDGPLSPLLAPPSYPAYPVLDRPTSFERASYERSDSESRSAPRELSRAHTVPVFSSSSSFPPIPEERSPPASSRTPRPSPQAPPSSYPRNDPSTPTPSSRRSPGDVRGLGRTQTMPNVVDSYPPSHSHSRSGSTSRMTSPMSSPNRYPRSQSPSTHSPGRSRKPSRSPLRNPLPDPPMPSSYTPAMWAAEKGVAAMSLNGHGRNHSQPVPQPEPHARELAQPRAHTYPQPQAQAPQHSSRPVHSPYPAQASTSVRPATVTSSASSAARAAAIARQESSEREREREREREQREREREREQPVRLRRGFWNRRGDYLLLVQRDGVEDMFIVYAPRDWANPPELRGYPTPTQGFMDHNGEVIKYDPTIPELPQSLPVHGEPPTKPYDFFVRYVDE